MKIIKPWDTAWMLILLQNKKLLLDKKEFYLVAQILKQQRLIPKLKRCLKRNKTRFLPNSVLMPIEEKKRFLLQLELILLSLLINRMKVVI